MNRREFGKLIAGTGVAATLPVSQVSAATVQRSKYIFAVALAHAKTDISADLISETFKIRPPTARALLSKLVRNGVVDAPNTHGIARLAEPLQRIVPQVVEYNPAGGYVVKGPLDQFTAKARQVAKRLIEDEHQYESTDVEARSTDHQDADDLGEESCNFCAQSCKTCNSLD